MKNKLEHNDKLKVIIFKLVRNIKLTYDENSIVEYVVNKGLEKDIKQAI
jgi:hypothetical protein